MKILIAIDNSQCSQMALDKVAQRQWPAGTQILILSVAEPLAPAYGLFVPGEVIDSQTKILVKAVERYSQLSGPDTGVVVDTRLEQGYARNRIAQVAREWDADLIVIGSHGRQGFEHAVLGSVAESVVHDAPCSVEVVKLKQKKRLKKVTNRQIAVNDQEQQVAPAGHE